MRLSLILSLVDDHPANANERQIPTADRPARRRVVRSVDLDGALLVTVDQRVGQFEIQCD